MLLQGNAGLESYEVVASTLLHCSFFQTTLPVPCWHSCVLLHVRCMHLFCTSKIYSNIWFTCVDTGTSSKKSFLKYRSEEVNVSPSTYCVVAGFLEPWSQRVGHLTELLSPRPANNSANVVEAAALELRELCPMSGKAVSSLDYAFRWLISTDVGRWPYFRQWRIGIVVAFPAVFGGECDVQGVGLQNPLNTRSVWQFYLWHFHANFKFFAASYQITFYLSLHMSEDFCVQSRVASSDTYSGSVSGQCSRHRILSSFYEIKNTFMAVLRTRAYLRFGPCRAIRQYGS